MTEDPREVRCPECGARNTTEAEWCTQCYTLLGTSAPTPPPPASPAGPTGDTGPAAGGPPGDPTAAPPPPPPPSPAAQDSVADETDEADEADGLLPLPPSESTGADGDAASDGPRALRSGEGRFRETDEGLEWVCGVCQEWNSIDRLTCSVCAAPLGRTVGAEAAPDRPDVSPAVLTVASLVLPGAGHWLLGMRGAAVLRAILGVVWGMGGLTLFLRARASGQSFLPAVPLLIGWAVVAAGSANDAVVEAGGSGSRVLDGRVLLWLTLAVVGGTFAAVLVGVLSAVGQ